MIRNDQLRHPLIKYVNCPLCGVDNYILRYPGTIPPSRACEKNADDFRCTSHKLSEHGDIVQCSECGMVYNNPQPDPEELLHIYKEVEDPLYLEESKAREYTFKRSLDQLHHFIKPPGTLLDVGCYTGAFMQVAEAEGWEVSGVEISTWAAEIARKTQKGPVYEVPLDQLSLPAASFDVITFWDVMEHLPYPTAFLQDTANLLKPGGILAFSTHMVDSLAVRLLGTRYPFFMDMHLVHFSRATAKRILEEHGYELLHIYTHHRILRMGYFLEKLSAKVPIGRSFFNWLSRKKWISNRFIRIGFLGLVNIFARKNT